MSKNYYEILEIEENLVRFILSKNEKGTYNVKERADENRNTIIRKAYENKKKKLEENFKEQKDELEDKYGKEIGIQNLRNKK